MHRKKKNLNMSVLFNKKIVPCLGQLRGSNVIFHVEVTLRLNLTHKARWDFHLPFIQSYHALIMLCLCARVRGVMKERLTTLTLSIHVASPTSWGLDFTYLWLKEHPSWMSTL